MAIKKSVVVLVTLVMSMMMVFGSAVSAFAAAPTREDVDYDGKGKVEVEFVGKVSWKNPVVTVKDTSGKTYKATIIKKDSDDITFKINGFKTGTKYNFVISGVKARGTSGYGIVKGTVTIPKAKAATKTIAKATAKTTAINTAVKKLGVKKSTIRDIDIEKDTFRGKKVWEVSFEGKRTGKSGVYEFEYIIDFNSGKVLKAEMERD